MLYFYCFFSFVCGCTLVTLVTDDIVTTSAGTVVSCY